MASLGLPPHVKLIALWGLVVLSSLQCVLCAWTFLQVIGGLLAGVFVLLSLHQAWECQKYFLTTDLSELLLACAGLQTDFRRTAIEMEAFAQVHRVDMTITVPFTAFNGYGARYALILDVSDTYLTSVCLRQRRKSFGWSALVSGTKEVIAEIKNVGAGSYVASFTVRIVGSYTFNIFYRGIPVLPSPIRFDVRAGESFDYFQGIS